MDLFLQQLLSGIAIGGVYALVALAVVMIYQASDHFNFAQGEMAMFSTYIAWSLIAAGLPYWLAFALTSRSRSRVPWRSSGSSCARSSMRRCSTR